MSGVTRRPLIAIAVLAVASLSGCATFTDNQVAARVGDTELSEDQLAALVREGTAADPSAIDTNRASEAQVAEVLNGFVLHEVLNADLARQGIFRAALGDDVTLDELRTAANDAIVTWQESPAVRPSDDDVATWYQSGTANSNLVCSAHILVATRAEADEVLDRLDAGEPFGNVAVDVSLDTGSAANGGALPCADVQTFATTYVSEFVAAALDAEIGVPVGPVESQFGFHVIRLRPLDDLQGAELDDVLAQPSVRFGFLTRSADVYINPRYGRLDPVAGIVPLG